MREEIYRQETWAGNRNKSREERLSHSNNADQVRASLREREAQLDQASQNGTVSSARHMGELAAQGVEINSLIISGHNGSGHLYGMAGDIWKDKIIEDMNEAYSERPELLDNLHSVYLWGCYTATQDEASEWREMLPSLRILGGFNGSGPSIGKLASNTVMYDLMMSENELFMMQEGDEILEAISEVENINYVLPGISLVNCREDQFYYSRSRSGGRTVPQFLETINPIRECNEGNFLSDYRTNSEEFLRYYRGELEIPENTSSGALRDIYNFIRQNEHCNGYIQDSSLIRLDSNQVGLLLFFEGVKGNFYNSFGDRLNNLKDVIEAIPENRQEFIENESGFFNNMIQRFALRSGDISEEDFEDLRESKSILLQTLETVPDNKEEFMSMSRSELLEMTRRLSYYSSAVSFSNVGLYSEDFRQTNARIIETNRALQTYLYGLNNSDCTQLGPWHEDHGIDNYSSSSSFLPDECLIEFN